MWAGAAPGRAADHQPRSGSSTTSSGLIAQLGDDRDAHATRNSACNGYRSHAWKYELQRVADELGLAIRVSHFPPGTSKWNKVEHRLFSFISINWRGRPLRTYETVVNLIANTTNHGGLVVRARLDKRRYPTGKRISANEFKTINIEPDRWHGDWNYVIRPRVKP